jgi:HEAT repeat protein
MRAPRILALGFLMLSAWDAQAAEEVRRLVDQLGNPSFDAREAAERQLLQIGDPAVSALEKAQRSDDPEVAARAEGLLKKIQWLERAPSREAVDRILAGTNMGRFEITEEMSPEETLNALSKAMGIPILLQNETPFSDLDFQVRSFSDGSLKEYLEALLRFHDLHITQVDGGLFISRKGVATRADMIPSLLSGLASDHEDLRYASAVLLCRLVGERMGYNPYDTPDRRALTVTAWQRWWAENADQIQKDCKVDENQRLGSEINALIQRLKDRTAHGKPYHVTAGAILHLSGGDEPNRRLSEIALREAPELALPKILELLGSESLNARHYAIDLLGSLKHAPAEPRLVALLKDPDPATVQLSAKALADMRALGAVGALREVVARNPDVLSRQFAAYALCRLGEKEGIPFFIECLSHPESIQRERAIMCLRILIGETFGFDHKEADPESAVRWKAWWEAHRERLRWDEKSNTFAVENP